MTDIPADIMALATKLLDGAYQFPDGTYATDAYEAIARAILAERERCAAIARREKNNTLSLMSMPPQSAAAKVIERDIRSGERVDMKEQHQIKFLGNLSRLDARPGDKFVLMTEGDVPHDMAMRITEEWKRFMGPDAPKLMILSDGIKIGVVSG